MPGLLGSSKQDGVPLVLDGKGYVKLGKDVPAGSGAAGPKGDKGDKGDIGPGGSGSVGPAGERGSIWLHTTKMPPPVSLTPPDGWKEGDQILHEGDGELFVFLRGAWTDEGISLLGPQGIQGVPGHVGATGPKGPAGPQGHDGHIGPQGPHGADGKAGAGIDIKGAVAAVGDLPPLTAGHSHHGEAYIVSATGDLYTPLTPKGGGPDIWTDVGHVQGSQGIRGVPGPVGHIGAPGAPGHDGAKGSDGPAGPQGARGDRGHSIHILSTVKTKGDLPTGAKDGDAHFVTGTGDLMVWSDVGGKYVDMGHVQGPDGPAGSPGPQGHKGDVGHVGPKGDPGPAGSAGHDGVAGPHGPLGPHGPAGPQGPRGHSIEIKSTVPDKAHLPTTGVPDGESHFVVDTGDLMVWSEHLKDWVDMGHVQGPEGPIGHVGPAGPAGAKGDVGLRGPQGIPGHTGAKGDPGAAGAAGAPGHAGADGKIGPRGAVGPKGLQGTAGTPGKAGATGGIGKTGATGAAGLKGATGGAGKAGATGPAGPKGATGSISDAHGDARYVKKTGDTMTGKLINRADIVIGDGGVDKDGKLMLTFNASRSQTIRQHGHGAGAGVKWDYQAGKHMTFTMAGKSVATMSGYGTLQVGPKPRAHSEVRNVSHSSGGPPSDGQPGDLHCQY